MNKINADYLRLSKTYHTLYVSGKSMESIHQKYSVPLFEGLILFIPQINDVLSFDSVRVKQAILRRGLWNTLPLAPITLHSLGGYQGPLPRWC